MIKKRLEIGVIDKVIDYLKYLVQNMPLDAILGRDNKIKELENKLSNNTEIEKYKIDKEVEKFKIEKELKELEKKSN